MQDGPRFLTEKSFHPSREVSFPRRMSSEMTDLKIFAAAAANPRGELSCKEDYEKYGAVVTAAALFVKENRTC